jgi:hypothetical protein
MHKLNNPTIEQDALIIKVVGCESDTNHPINDPSTSVASNKDIVLATDNHHDSDLTKHYVHYHSKKQKLIILIILICTLITGILVPILTFCTPKPPKSTPDNPFSTPTHPYVEPPEIDVEEPTKEPDPIVEEPKHEDPIIEEPPVEEPPRDIPPDIPEPPTRTYT